MFKLNDTLRISPTKKQLIIYSKLIYLYLYFRNINKFMFLCSLVEENHNIITLQLSRMFKKLTIGALIAVAALSQHGPSMVGGYKPVDPTALKQMQNDAIFEKAMSTARTAYRSQNNGELGTLLSVSQQVVSGMNYKMIFETQNGEYEVTVYVQPWTDKYQVLEMKPVINKQ